MDPQPTSADSQERSELERTQELYDLLRGKTPGNCRYKKSHQPKLTDDQAWTVIWWLGNQYWQVRDYIERCCVCGDLYDSEREGDCLDYGRAPYHFCDSCISSDAYVKKAARNPENLLNPAPSTVTNS